MAEQSRLEKEGFEKRSEKEFISRVYQNENGKIYNETHPDALSGDDAQGKGTGVSMGYAVRNLNAPKSEINYSNMDTTSEAGGIYDKEGRGALKGIAGRHNLMLMNTYSKENAYGVNSVDTSANVVAGQIVIE